MDLLQAAWIPVRADSGAERVTLQQLLCSDVRYQLRSHRDDFELASLQLLISLVQVLLPPADRSQLRQRLAEPLAVDSYHNGIQPYHDGFRLDHPRHPFMQSRGVKATDVTPVQKLFIGLPEGNNHAFFNDRGEISRVCGSCAAIALFNQASNCPSFGGGFKGSLRGSAPITTFAAGEHLRETLWLNVLLPEYLPEFPDATHVNNSPVWIDPIVARTKVYAHQIGLLRGLFWQPARVELVADADPRQCDACRCDAEQMYSGLRKEKFVYELEGIWPHPHSPRIWDIKKSGPDRERFLSFTTSAPAWTQLNYCSLPQEDKKSGSVPSPIVKQFRDVFPRRRLNLLVSGYRVNQASVIERRHELFSMPQDWSRNAQRVETAIHYAIDVKQELRNKLYGFAKQVGPGLHEIAERRFYHASEPMIHELLRDMDRREGKAALLEFKQRIDRLARNLFETLTEPYRHDPEGLKFFALFRGSFERALAKLNA